MFDVHSISFQLFQLFEHSHEKELLQKHQEKLIGDRENLTNTIYNLTSNLTDEELDLLYNYANRGLKNSTDDDDEVLKVFKT